MSRIFRTRMLEHIFLLASPQRREKWSNSLDLMVLQVGKVIRASLLAVRVFAIALIAALSFMSWPAFWIGSAVILVAVFWFETSFMGNYQISNLRKYPEIHKLRSTNNDFPYFDECEVWQIEINEAFYDQSIFAVVEHERIKRDTKEVLPGAPLPPRRL